MRPTMNRPAIITFQYHTTSFSRGAFHVIILIAIREMIRCRRVLLGDCRWNFIGRL